MASWEEARWTTVLDQLERDLVQAHDLADAGVHENQTIAEWVPPADMPELPASLLPRAQYLMQHFRAANSRVHTALDDIRKQQRALKKVDDTRESQPVYLNEDI